MLQNLTGKPAIETEESLRSSRELLKQFASHLQTLREEEKVNLSRELHDSLGQSLTGLNIYARRIFKGLHRGITEDQIDTLRGEVRKMIEIIDSSLKGVKKIARDLYPRILDEFGLIPAIEIFSEEFTASLGLKCKMIKETRKIEIAKGTSLEVYRIFQETVSNILCKSDTNVLTVKMSEDDDLYFIEILDDGLGQNEVSLFESNSIRITGLYERVKNFGGNLQISAIDKAGLRVVLSIPKKENE
jgi:signal transduction histidine kinase